MTTLYISGLFLSHLGNNVHLQAMQEQLGEEQKKASSSYLFSYTKTSRMIVSASGKLEAQLPPVEGQAQHKEHVRLFFVQRKPTNPAIQTCTSNNLLGNYFNIEIHMVGWKEWCSDFKTTKIETKKPKTVRFQKVLLMLLWLERDTRPQGSYSCRDVKTLVTSITDQ